MSVLFINPLAVTAANAEAVLSGTVIDADSKQPLDFVVVSLADRNLWAQTNAEGKFTFNNLAPGKYTIEVKYTGYKPYSETVNVIPGMKPLQIKLHELSLALDEVVVTAEPQKMGSASLIDRTAVQHIQPKSLEDMLQLVPGNVTKNPDLSSVGQAQIRELGDNANNSMGTLVVVDGAPMTNDANMQVISTAKGGTAPEHSTAGKGVDLRLVSPDNIESVEVIRGIPSVEYGNLTSGAVIVKSRSGATPLELSFKADPYSKMVFAGKGFGLRSGGAINVSADYSQSYADIRRRYIGYDRITFSSGYSNVFNLAHRPISFNARFAFFSSLNNEKSDPELKYNERVNNKTIGGRFNIEGNWRLNLPWITGLSYAASANFTYESDFSNRQVILQSGITPVGNATTNKEYQTFFLSSTYYAWSRIQGKPLDLYAQLKATKLVNFNEGSFMNFKLGAEWRFNKNYGRGMTFDEKQPPQVTNNQSIRPRPFSDIPAMNVFSWFLEDKYTQPLGTTLLNVQAGVRMSTLFVDKELAHRGNITTLEPRVNADYSILNRANNSLFDDLSIVGGYGIGSKTPTLLQLYPDKAYFDVTSYTMLFRDDVTGENGKSIAIMTTNVVDDTSNPKLKPSYSYKLELGLSFRIRNVRGMINFFNEKHTNEFGYISRPVVVNANKYSTPDAIESVRYENGNLQYLLGNQWTNADVTNKSYFFNYVSPSNHIRTDKYGIEYQLSLATIPAIRTSVTVDGSYLHIKRRSTGDYHSAISATYKGDNYPLMPVYPGGSGTVSSRFNTNFRFITHIPSLRMVFTTTLQMIWSENYRDIYENADGKSLYYKMDDPFSPGTTKYFVNPVGFMDANGSFTPWQPGFETNELYRYMLLSYSHNNAFGTEHLPVSAILNFRLSKEFGKMLEISFMANNFLQLTKTHKLKTSVGWKDITIPMYFGAEATIKF
ncbi:MAG: carboxypeptidase-like regulatory domain-containing protein [Muribaculum sp.]|nr:carboxypeptidase-like regulatory domain-containing protein [Muribaculum sp.]